jgi:pimeloyl-ACP methyl ester carboxylesterase
VRVASIVHHAEAPARRVVLMVHGFKSSKMGPSRYFVDVARRLSSRGISSVRFDQPGSGDSEGAFEDSSFSTWIETVGHVLDSLVREGAKVAILGQSMGGGAAVVAAAERDALSGLALWSAGLHGRRAFESKETWMEEEGQRVRAGFWHEVAAIDFLERYRRLGCPAYMIYGTADDLIPIEDIRAVEAALKPGDEIRIVEGLPHSAWPEPPRMSLLRETEDRLAAWLAAE